MPESIQDELKRRLGIPPDTPTEDLYEAIVYGRDALELPIICHLFSRMAMILLDQK